MNGLMVDHETVANKDKYLLDSLDCHSIILNIGIFDQRQAFCRVIELLRFNFFRLYLQFY
jgi:hypothetical protein